MNNGNQNQIKLHSAGAIIRHKSSFENLKSFQNNLELDQEFIDKWVVPFYMKIGHYSNTDWVEEIKNISKEITEDITLKLLGDFNWRTRLVGAYFSAIKNFQNQIEIIGIHFLKSEVCCVGHIYALILAFYNNEKTLEYLELYLEYYLDKPNLYFDQESALEALLYLDEINKTDKYSKFHESWLNLNIERNKIQNENAINFAKIIEKEQGKSFAKEYLNERLNQKNETRNLKTEYTKKQVSIIADLQKHCS